MFPVLQFAIDECTRQNDLTYESVGNMVLAYDYAWNSYVQGQNEHLPYTITEKFILALGRIVKPEYNHKGYRQTPVVFANGKSGAPYQFIERLINQLLDNMHDLSPNEFYVEFEKIHPFEDGNGRVGAILWNLLMKNYSKPICPPDFFNK